MRGLQDVIGNIAGLCHFKIAIIHRLSHDDRKQTVLVGDLLSITRLQRCHCRQKVTLLINKTKYIGNITEAQLAVETFLECFIVAGLVFMLCECFELTIVFKVF